MNRTLMISCFACWFGGLVPIGTAQTNFCSWGQKSEDPSLPGGGQVSGGHMRMVIGYNLAKNQVLFTDSWVAGHELKRMTLLDAYDVTLGLYSMAPRGL